MNKKMRMFQALLIVAILLLQMIIPIVPIYAKTSENIWKETFENGVDGWKFFDADGDSDNWNLLSSNESGFKPYRGNYLLASDSLNRTPDNYAVSPAIDIPAEKVGDMEALNLSWYRSALSGYSFAEQYTVYVYKGNSEDPSLNEIKANSEQIYNETIRYGEEYGKIKIDFTAYKGETIRLVFRHHDCPNLQALMIDDISIDASYTNASQTSFGFEDENAGWSFIDADGDGFNWFTSKVYPYEGRKSIVSDSYRRRECNPKNYAISPIIDVSGKTHLQLDWYAGASSESNYKEHYAVYIYPYNNEEDSSKVPTVEDISKLTPVFEEKLDTYEYTKKTVDLNKYINYDKIRVIFYHYIPDGGSAQASLIIDSISITGIGGASHTAKFFVDGTLFNSQLYTEGSSILSPVPIPGKAGYTFVGWEPEVKVMGTEDIAFNAVFSESTAKLENIKIAKQPTKLEYAEGENFDRTGMEVKACYSDGTEVGVTNYCEITNGENLTKGQTNVTIKYREDNKTVETTQAITVKAEDPNTEKTIQFKDENLYNAIKEKLGEKVKSASDKDLKLTALKSDVESINRLYLSQENGTADSAKITDISGIENFKGVNRLFLSNNQISNISALSELTNLTDLGLSNNKISDISALSGLANLTSLYLENNQISEINALSGLTKLTKLELSNNKINNISTLSNITSLKSLNLNSNEINDIKDLSDLTDLTNLHLANNKINDINTVSRLVNLTNLGLANNQISDISSLSTLVNLTYLNLSSNMISDISTLSGLTKLTDLNLTNQEITKNILKTEDEVELPQIFKATKEKNSKVYTEKEYEFQNCELTADKTKVKLKEKGQSATVKIVGGKAEGTTLNVVVTGETQKTLESIKITKQPTKLEYTEGESFDKAGMEVKACYSDKTETVITNYEITNGENLTKGQTSVTIKYTEGEKTVEATQAITVKAEDPNAEKTIQFKDENLYNEIKSILGDKIKDYNDEELTIKAIKKDIEEINSIGPLREVDDISGIGNFTGLESLSLIDNNLSDISEVEKLTNLTHFSISHTQVEDIKAISKLTNLKILNIEASKVTDISGLKDLVNLNELYLIQNDIKNIDVIKNFKNLQILKARENQISDISAVAGLSNLRSLWIADNQISDANPIQKLPNLKYYGLENQQVTKYILKTQKEVELPPIFTQAKDKNSKIYTEKEYEFINCKLNEDGTKVILTTVGENATVKISGGKADGTTLNIIAVDEIPKELTSIEIAIHPGKFIYTEGEDFDTTGLKVEAKYSDGSSKELKEGEYEIVDGKNLKLGQETVTIRYTEGEKTVETTQKVGVTAKTPEEQKTLESIKITTAPTKTKYTESEKFDKKGMKVTATYSDKTEKEVTDYTYTPEGELKTTDTAITVSYKEGEKTVEAKYTITVKAKPPVAQKTLESIKVTTAPTKTTYTEGEKFDKAGMKVTATYSDKTEKEVTDYTYTPEGELKTTDTAITVSYKEGEKTVEAKYTITVKAKPPVAQKTLESIKVTTAPTKTAYTEGEKFDKTGMKVIATYSDGTTKEVTDYTYTPAGELKTTDTAITVSYKEGEKTVEAKYTITVKAKPPVAQKTLESIKVTTAPTRTTYTEGEKFDKTGMKVIAKYSDGTTKEIRNYAYTPAGELKTTDKTITVSYTENEVTKTATQEITVVAKGNSGDEPGGETEKVKLDSIEIKEAPTKTVYTEGEKFDKTGMKVIAKYSDGTTKEIKNYAYTPAGALTKKDTTITVSYTENGVTKTDTQKIKIQNKDDGTGAKDKFPDTGAQIPIISGIVLMFAVAVASVVKIKRLTGI